MGSPTALADAELEESLRSAAVKTSLFLPSGAFWGGEDIKKMAESGSLQVKFRRTFHKCCIGPEHKHNTICICMHLSSTGSTNYNDKASLMPQTQWRT